MIHCYLIAEQFIHEIIVEHTIQAYLQMPVGVSEKLITKETVGSGKGLILSNMKWYGTKILNVFHLNSLIST
jgi:hypothetical protein